MKKRTKLQKLLVFISIFLTVSFANVGFSSTAVQAATTYSQQLALSEVKELISTYYIGDIPEGTLNKTDIREMVSSLKDPYSQYFSKAEYDELVGQINNDYVGIGIGMDTAAEGMKVTTVYENSPAAKAGIKIGDIVTEADGHVLAGLSLDKISSYILGGEGTSVTLKVKRNGQVLNFTLTRQVIDLPTVYGKVEDKHIGYIAITSFGENTGEEFRNKLIEVNKSSVDSYIIDLRYNPGGYIGAAEDILGYFLDEKPYINLKEKNYPQYSYNTPHKDLIIDKPVVLLVNNYSASASEIMTAALKDYKKVLIIGENTYGKGVGQELFSLSDGGYLKLTVFKFLSPLGKEINHIGIAPDIQFKDSDDYSVDSMLAAEILLSKTSDKAKAMKINYGSNSFEIDSSYLSKSDYKATADYLMKNVFAKKDIYLWNSSDNGWKKAYTESSNTMLKKITINGKTISGFSFGKTNYTVKLPASTARLPLVGAAAVDPKAKVEITQANMKTRTVTIKVTAEDGKTVKVYTVRF